MNRNCYYCGRTIEVDAFGRLFTEHRGIKRGVRYELPVVTREKYDPATCKYTRHLACSKCIEKALDMLEEANNEKDSM